MKAKNHTLWIACLALGAPASVSADVIYSIDVESLYNDNIYLLQDDDVDAFLNSVRPGVQLEMIQGEHTFVVEVEGEQGIYTKSKNGSDDYTDYFVRGEGKLEFNIRNRLQFNAKSEKGHDERGSGRMDTAGKTIATLADTPDVWRNNSANVLYTFGAKDSKARVSFGGGVNDREYTNNTSIISPMDQGTSGLDHADSELRAIGYLKVLPRTSVVLEARAKEIDYDEMLPINRDSSVDSYFLGLEWESTAKTTGAIRVGYQEKDPDDVAQKDFDSTAYEAKVVWQPKTYSSLTFDAFRGVEDSSNSVSVLDREIYFIGWHHDWTSRLGSDIYARRESDDYQSFSRNDDIDSFGLAAVYDLTEWMKVKGGYEYSDRNSTGLNLDYETNKVLLGVDVELR